MFQAVEAFFTGSGHMADGAGSTAG
jgi:hypothetical protein